MTAPAPIWETLFQATAVPTTKDENFKYTSLKELDVKSWPSAAPSGRATFKGEALQPLTEEGLALCLRSSQSGFTILKNEISADMDVQWMVSDEGWGVSAPIQDDIFARLTLARSFGVLRIKIAPRARIEKPIRVVLICEDEVFYPRISIELGAQAQAALVLETAGIDTAASVSSLLQIKLEDSSELTCATFQNWGEQTRYFERQVFDLSRASHLRVIAMQKGGLKGQTRTETFLRGEGARSELKAATRASASQHFDYWISTEHLAPRTTSALDYWTVLGGRSRAIFNSRVVIPTGMSGADAYQKNRNLLLSREAVVDTIPKLEIAHDDVKCAHGASASPINEEQLYYLMSRGILRPQAEAMIVDGFTDPVLQGLPMESFRERVRSAL